MKKLIGAKIILEDRVVSGYGIVFDKRIVRVDKIEALSSYECETISVDGYISAGFIDTHIHGASSFDFMDDSAEAIEIIADALVKYGTTSFLATTITQDEEKIKRALSTAKNYKRKKGANLLGVHLEGPFLSPKYLGAQNGSYIIKPNNTLIEDYSDIIKIITIAPEEDKNYSFIKKWSEAGIVMSMGHTNATYDEVKEANHNGLTHATHLFNAMRPIHHREPGPVIAALNLNLTVELITDGHHIDPVLYEFVVKNKGVDNVVLITDSIRATGLSDGVYELGGQSVILKDGKCTLESGQLAGSVHTMNRAVKNMLDNTSLELHEVIKMATINPARLIGEMNKGRLKKGYDADIIVFDESLSVKRVFIDGKAIV